MRFNLRGPHPQIYTCVDPTTHTASPARAPHQRHDPHQQRVQNIGPRGGPQPTRHESNIQQARNFLRGGVTSDLPALGDQPKTSLVITRSLNVIAWFVLPAAQYNVVGLVQGGGLTFHHQSKCNRMRQCLPDDCACGALAATNLQHTSCDRAVL